MRNRTTQPSQERPGRSFAGRSHGLIACSLALFFLILSANVAADSFRCGRKVVRSGDDASELLRACGEPQRRDSAQEALWTGASQKTVKMHRWYYKTSGRKLERVVLLYQGKIVAVRTGKR